MGGGGDLTSLSPPRLAQHEPGGIERVHGIADSLIVAPQSLADHAGGLATLLMEVPISTRKVALCTLHVLGDLVEALKQGDVVGLYTASVAAITSLACHARRAHPE